MHLKAGDRLPPERELCQRFGVSRTALRSAIGVLILSNVLESIQGSGTYVCPRKPINIFQEIYSFSDSIRRAGLEPSSRVLEVGLVLADAGVAAKIGLDLPDPRCSRLNACAMPATRLFHWSIALNASLCQGIERFDFSCHSLYEVLQRVFGVIVEHGTDRISITTLRPDGARQFWGAMRAKRRFISAACRRRQTARRWSPARRSSFPSSTGLATMRVGSGQEKGGYSMADRSNLGARRAALLDGAPRHRGAHRGRNLPCWYRDSLGERACHGVRYDAFHRAHCVGKPGREWRDSPCAGQGPFSRPRGSARDSTIRMVSARQCALRMQSPRCASVRAPSARQGDIIHRSSPRTR